MVSGGQGPPAGVAGVRSGYVSRRQYAAPRMVGVTPQDASPLNSTLSARGRAKPVGERASDAPPPAGGPAGSRSAVLGRRKRFSMK